MLPRLALLTLACALSSLWAPLAHAALPVLKISPNQRFLVHADGSPFFFLADTAWELLHRCDRAETERYLKKRAEQGFTVIQTVVLAELDGLNVPNAAGHLPLFERDPLRPNEEYFAHVDWVLARAESLGLRVALLPTWGDKWNKKWGDGPEIFTPANSAAFGEWLGRRYADRAVIWVVGGDRPIESEDHAAIVRAMARGLRRGDRGRNLITFHPPGGAGSAQWFHAEDWLDFNLRQNGHASEFTDRYAATRTDYARTPVKPVIDGEPLYEGHPISFNAKLHGHSIAADVRRPFYWDVFSGACGHTYGHHSVWQMAAPGRKPVNAPLLPWTDALDEVGANQMQHGRRLMESRPFLTRVPDDKLIVETAVPTAMPGAGHYRFMATRDADGSYAMIYVPVGRAFSVRLGNLSGMRVKAWWFNPRTGEATFADEFPRDGERRFLSPTPGELLDWVLVLDDASRGYPPPGTIRRG
jgi:hypothetical protein